MSKFWNFVPVSDEEVELRVEGEIIDDSWAWIYDWFGDPYASPNQFRQALAEHKGKNVTVWIDSWGGDVFAGMGIYNALLEHRGKKTVKVEKAVSAGHLIAMAGDVIHMMPGGIMMMHNVWGAVVGEAKDMRHTADVYDEIKEAILNVYERKTGKDRSELSRMMDEETWMSAKKAVADGFADDVLHMDTEQSANASAFSFSRLAIQNSATAAMQKFFEKWQEKQTSNKDQAPEVTPANNRISDIKMRVSVRERQNRRYAHNG